MTDDLKKSEGGLLNISFFNSEKDNAPTKASVSWEELLPKSDERGSKSGPSWSPARFSGTRAARNVVELSCLVFDLDAEITQELAEKLEPFTYHAHTTHTPGRWRIIVKTSRPHKPDEHKALWKYVDNLCGNVFDEACTDASRLYYFPSHRPGIVPESVSNEGLSIEVDRVLGSKPVGVPYELPAVDLEPLREKAKKITDRTKRDLVLNVLSLDWAPGPGERNTLLHRAFSTIAQWGISDSEATALIESMLSRMDVTPEGEGHWRGVLESSLNRGVEFHANNQAVVQAAQRAIEEQSVAAGETPNWRATMQRVENDDGSYKYKPSGSNVEIILRNHSDFKDLRFNVVSRKVECSSGPLAGADFNVIDTRLSNWLSRSEFKLNISRADCLAQVSNIVADRHYDPLKEYLNGLVWDGTPRITDVLRKHCGVVDGGDFYVNKVSRMFFIAAARRGLEPGTQVDSMLILKGFGGAGKTSFVRVLGGEFAAETTLDIHNKDALMGITGKWLVEQAEMATMRKADEEAFRAFVTRVSDEFRPPYGRIIESFPRRCVFVGTSNTEMLNDVEGVRRFWPVTVGKIDLGWFKENRDQLWAEAVQAAKSSEVHYFSDEERVIIEPEVNMFQSSDLLGEFIQDWFMHMQKSNRPKEVTMKQVLTGATELSGKELLERRYNIQVGKALQLLGFVKKRRNTGRRDWYYETPTYILEGVTQGRLQLVTPPPEEGRQ